MRLQALRDEVKPVVEKDAKRLIQPTQSVINAREAEKGDYLKPIVPTCMDFKHLFFSIHSSTCFSTNVCR